MPDKETTDEQDVITVSTGVKFKVKPISIWLYTELDKQLDALAPEVPTTPRDDGRQEENRASPAYQAALKQYNEMRTDKMHELAVFAGTELLEVPEGFSTAEDDGWTSIPKQFGVTIATNGKERFFQWIRYSACPSQEDMMLIFKPILKMMGVGEKEVWEALDRFRSESLRSADQGSGDKQDGRHGHKTGTITRRTRAPAGGDAGSTV